MNNKLTFFQDIFCNEEDKRHILNNMENNRQHAVPSLTMQGNGDEFLLDTPNDALDVIEFDNVTQSNEPKQTFKGADSFDELFDMITSDSPTDATFDEVHEEVLEQNDEVEVFEDVFVEDKPLNKPEDNEVFEIPLI